MPLRHHQRVGRRHDSNAVVLHRINELIRCLAGSPSRYLLLQRRSHGEMDEPFEYVDGVPGTWSWLR